MNRRTFEYDAVFTSAEKVDRGSTSVERNSFSTMAPYCSAFIALKSLGVIDPGASILIAASPQPTSVMHSPPKTSANASARAYLLRNPFGETRDMMLSGQALRDQLRLADNTDTDACALFPTTFDPLALRQ